MKTVIVGCGHISRVHIRAILKIPEVKLAAVCDKDEIRAQELAKEYGVPFFKDLSQMLKEIKPDVAHILTPPQSHATLAIMVLEAGCQVFVEKPLCLNIQEAEHIFRTAEKVNLTVGVDHSFLWSPFVKKATEIINSGKLGRIVSINYVIGDDFLEVVKSGYSRWALGLKGGIFSDLIPHPLYIIHSLLPDIRLSSAFACGTSIYDLRELWVNFFGGGAGVNLYLSLVQRPLEHAIRIYCARGTIHIDLRNYNVAVIPERQLPGPLARLINTFSEMRQRQWGTFKNAGRVVLGHLDPWVGTTGAIRDFYKAILESGNYPVSPQKVKAVVELSDAIWEKLENTPGAIFSPKDEKGNIAIRKTKNGFVHDQRTSSAKIMVTGGTGFIGSHLVKRLVSDGNEVRVFCRHDSDLSLLPEKGIELSFGDVSDFDAAEKAMQGIELIYHLAATMHGDWAEHYWGTVIGTKNIIQAALKRGVKKIVYVSSIGVLNASHYPQGGIVAEDFPLEQRPEDRGYYSRAKLEAERVVQEYIDSGRLNICVIRPGLVYGSGSKRFLSDAGFKLSNNLVLVVGLGGRRLGLTYVENLIDALILAAKSGWSSGKIFNILDSKQPTVREYIRIYQKVSGNPIFAVCVPVVVWQIAFGFLDLFSRFKGRPSHLFYRLRLIVKSPRFNNMRARQELGWEPKISFFKGMQKTFQK